MEQTQYVTQVEFKAFVNEVRKEVITKEKLHDIKDIEKVEHREEKNEIISGIKSIKSELSSEIKLIKNESSAEIKLLRRDVEKMDSRFDAKISSTKVWLMTTILGIGIPSFLSRLGILIKLLFDSNSHLIH